MRFVMYLNDQPVDSIPLPRGQANISKLIEEMKDKNKDVLKSAVAQPVFALESVPSYVNHFEPLKPPVAIEK